MNETRILPELDVGDETSGRPRPQAPFQRIGVRLCVRMPWTIPKRRTELAGLTMRTSTLVGGVYV
jgi:hypothetical protein